jgi:plasmid replication initiation protein
MKKNNKKQKRDISLVRKSNDFIEARYKFDIWEMRFFLSVLSKIERDDQNFQVYRVKYRDIIKDFGLSSNNAYAMLREGAKNLMKKTVTLKYEKDGVTRAEMYHLIRKIDYLEGGQATKEDSENHEYIDVKIEEDLKPFLLQLSKNFTAYDLKNVAKLGTYSIRIYELLKQYESIGKRTLKVEEMKLMFDLTKEYPLFANFYQKVIEPAVKEINKYSDLRVAIPEKIKDGKRIEALRFRFSKRTLDDSKTGVGEVEQSKLNINDYENIETLIFEDAEIMEIVGEHNENDKKYMQFEDVVVKNFGVTPSVFFQLVGKHSIEQIEQAIRVTRRAKVNAQIKTSVPGYFVQALKEGYTDQKEEQDKKKVLELEQEKLLNDKIREIVEKDPHVTTRAIERLRNDMPTKKRVEVKERQLGRMLEVQDYREDKILMTAVKAMIIQLKKEEVEF